MQPTLFRNARWVRKPPVPIALIGAVIGLLLFTALVVGLSQFGNPFKDRSRDTAIGAGLKIFFMMLGMSVMGSSIFATRRWFNASAKAIMVATDTLSFGAKCIPYCDIRSVRYRSRLATDNIRASESSTTVDTLIVIDHANGSLALIALGCDVIDIEQAL